MGDGCDTMLDGFHVDTGDAVWQSKVLRGDESTMSDVMWMDEMRLIANPRAARIGGLFIHLRRMAGMRGVPDK
jgi:hypothetical protein